MVQRLFSRWVNRSHQREADQLRKQLANAMPTTKHCAGNFASVTLRLNRSRVSWLVTANASKRKPPRMPAKPSPTECCRWMGQ